MMPIRFAIAVLALGCLGGCADTYAPKGEPSFYRNLAQSGAELDAAAAASMISGYRANNGLPAVVLDPELMRLAQAQAEIMAKRDKLDHGAGKPFVQRLKASGYDARTAAENISAGYHTLAEAFSGWRELEPAPGQYAAGRRDPHGHRCGLYAGFEVQGLLVADPGRPGREERIVRSGAARHRPNASTWTRLP